MFSRYRVKEVKGRFIPQIWFFGWYGIDQNSRFWWSSNEHQYIWCAYSTLEQARARIQEYRGYKDETKYHRA